MMFIKFDETCAGWNKDTDYIMLYLGMQADYIKELFKHRGYIYLNQVYEYFGAVWKPKDHIGNYLYLNCIEFEFEPIDNGAIMIKVTG